MSVILFIQESAQIVSGLPVWGGWTAFGAVSAVGIAMYNINSSKLSKKVSKEVFDEYKDGHTELHKEYRDDIREIKEGINSLRTDKQDKK